MVYRRDPVPRTGRSGRRWYCYFKRPRTRQERRQAAAAPEFVRTRRKWNKLPHNFQDNHRADYGDHCWKLTKKRLRKWMK